MSSACGEAHQLHGGVVGPACLILVVITGNCVFKEEEVVGATESELETLLLIFETNIVDWLMNSF